MEGKPYQPAELHYTMKWGSIISDTFLFQDGARKETLTLETWLHTWFLFYFLRQQCIAFRHNRNK